MDPSMSFLITVVRLFKESVYGLDLALMLFRSRTGSQTEQPNQVVDTEEMEEVELQLILTLTEEKGSLECLVEVAVQLIK